MNITERAENELQALLESVAPTYHVALNGTPEDDAIIYRLTGEQGIYESGERILTRITAQIYLYQHTYEAQTVDALRTALGAAGWGAQRGTDSKHGNWGVEMGAQTLEDGFYRDELAIIKTYNHEEME